MHHSLVSTNLLTHPSIYLPPLPTTYAYVHTQQRADLISGDMLDDMTEGFVGYIREELATAADEDSKVVYVDEQGCICVCKVGSRITESI